MDFAEHPDHAAIRDTVAAITRSFGSMLTDMVHRSLDPPWEQTVEMDVAQLRRAWGSAGMREGIGAYAERREPGFIR